MAKDFYIGLKVETSLGEAVQGLADADRRTMSDYVRGVLLDHVEASGRVDKSQAAKLKRLAKD
ncbi:hypothetical protein IIC68_00895 [archaeon]|nr:hypothetical protein [archaeon]